MTELTKEWLQQKIANMETARDEIPFGLGEDGTNTLAALRIALASLEAEAAGWQVKKHGGNWVSIKKEDVDHYRFNEELPVREVYTATPSPVVPDAIPKLKDGQRFKYVKYGIRYSENYANGWNACRSAMLQGADGNSPVIPDGLRLALSNAGIAAPESDEMLAATCEKYIQALVTWVKERKPFRSAVIPDGWVACSERMPEIGVDVLACTISPIGGFEEIETAQWHGGMKGEQPVFITSADAIEPTHWMTLPAAPQQEA